MKHLDESTLTTPRAEESAARQGAGGSPAAGPVPERLALSVEEAGALLGISRDLAYDLVNRRELPVLRLGRRLVVPRRALERFLDEAAGAAEAI